MSYLEQKNYEIIWDVIEKLFPDLKSASDYGSIIHAHPNCYYEIKDYCETHYGIERPSVNQIGEVIEDKKTEIKEKIQINTNYDFEKETISSMPKVKNILEERQYEQLIIDHNFILASHPSFTHGILIFVTDEKYVWPIETKISELHEILNKFSLWLTKLEDKSYDNSSFMIGALTDYGWKSNDLPKFRWNALRRKLLTEGCSPLPTLRALKTLKTVDQNAVSKDKEWVIKNQMNFFSLKNLLKIKARNIIKNEDCEREHLILSVNTSD